MRAARETVRLDPAIGALLSQSAGAEERLTKGDQPDTGKARGADPVESHRLLLRLKLLDRHVGVADAHTQFAPKRG